MILCYVNSLIYNQREIFRTSTISEDFCLMELRKVPKASENTEDASDDDKEKKKKQQENFAKY